MSDLSGAQHVAATLLLNFQNKLICFAFEIVVARAPCVKERLVRAGYELHLVKEGRGRGKRWKKEGEGRGRREEVEVESCNGNPIR